MTHATLPLLATVHTEVLTTLVPLLIVGAAAVYVLLPRPRPYWASGAILLAALAVIGARHLLLSTGAVTVETFLFYTFSFFAVISGGLLVTQHNPARAALAFAVVILSVCGLFLLLAAPFLAAASIIIYAGAIIVTFLFVLMLAQQSGRSDADARSREPLFSTFTGFILLGALLYVLQVTYVKNEASQKRDPDPNDVLSDVLSRTREAKGQLAHSQPSEYRRLRENITDPLDKVVDKRDQDTPAQLPELKPLRDTVQTILYEPRNPDQMSAALVRVERLVLHTLQQPTWIRPPVPSHLMSDLSGPSANEPVENLRCDDQGRPQMPADNPAYLGRSLFTDYLLAIELGGFLLLVAVIGSVAIAHRRTPSLPSERPA
jgi:NADH:ubiquinone oxidoreductase subunit 6 (subunit J)